MAWKRNSGKRDRDSYFRQSETWPEEVQEVNWRQEHQQQVGVHVDDI